MQADKVIKILLDQFYIDREICTYFLGKNIYGLFYDNNVIFNSIKMVSEGNA